MLVDLPARDQRVELVAAALCDSELSLPGAWVWISQDRREVYRREARELLTQLDTLPPPRPPRGQSDQTSDRTR